jgi:hypothetical protein
MRTRHLVRVPLAVLVLLLAGCTGALPTQAPADPPPAAAVAPGEDGVRTDEAESSPGWVGGGGRL